jgi:hypothetical protein
LIFLVVGVVSFLVMLLSRSERTIVKPSNNNNFDDDDDDNNNNNNHTLSSNTSCSTVISVDNPEARQIELDAAKFVSPFQCVRFCFVSFCLSSIYIT